MDFINKINFIQRITTRFSKPSPTKKQPHMNNNLNHNKHSPRVFNITPSDNYIYAKLDSLPENGWIQGCCCCFDPTTRIEHIGLLQTYLCGKCAKLPKSIKLKIVNYYT
jgi:hypothetical protein